MIPAIVNTATNTNGATARIALFAALGAAAVAGAIRSAGRNDLSPRWATGVPLVAPACMAVAILLIHPALVERSNVTPVCEEIPGSQICVEPELVAALPTLTAGATSTINQFGYGAATQDIEAGIPLSDLVSFPYYSNSPEQSESETAITTSRVMTVSENRAASAELVIAAPAAQIFELIADPAKHSDWDGNDNIKTAASSQRVREIGGVFSVTLTRGSTRENHVVEFVEGRQIAWKPAEPGQPPVGHLWRWELEPLNADITQVVQTYDWTDLHDLRRHERARWTTADRLLDSMRQLASLAESPNQ